MLLDLDPSAILNDAPDGKTDAALLRPYVIRGMAKLGDAGHQFRIGSDKTLPSETVQLLKREGITLHRSGPVMEQPADAQIFGSDRGIMIEREQYDADGELESETIIITNWSEWSGLLLPARTASVQRLTRETEIEVSVNLDGEGTHEIKTGIGFYDHMLEQISRHGGIDLKLRCKGDLHIDAHHTIEDTALALGEAIEKALGEKRGITRYASSILPMDEALATVALDLSGRPYFVFKSQLRRDSVGDFPVEMTHHFFNSLAMSLKATLHAGVTGENDHHQIEALFKAFAISLKQAVRRSGSNEIPSSKGVL